MNSKNQRVEAAAQALSDNLAKAVSLIEKHSAVILRPDGTSEALALKHRGRFTFEEVQEWLGGYYEVVALTKLKKTMIMDEEGGLKGLPPNLAATYFFRQEMHSRVIPDGLPAPLTAFFDKSRNQTIVGDVIVCSRRHFK